MKSKKSLYDVLDLSRGAQVAEVRAAYRREVDALDAQRGTLSVHECDERLQLLRIAYSTLTDPASRMVYDADLDAAARTALPALQPNPMQAVNAAGARADALGLRADALALRAEAILARAEVDGGGSYGRFGRGLGQWGAALGSTGRILILLFLVSAVLGTVSRCSMSRAAKENERLETLHQQASEKAALQEYYQAHGVRPANMAELQLLEAERQRQENAERQASSERRRAEEAQQRWEAESRRIGDQVTRNRIQAEEQSREEHQRLKFEAERLALEISETQDDRQRRRLELELRQLKERMKAQ